MDTAGSGRAERLELSFELAGGAYAVTAARLALAEIDGYLDSSLAFDVRLLVSELVTNSVEHAGVGPEDSIAMQLEIDAAQVRVVVSDGGPGFKRPAGNRPEEGNRGWGLFLVEQIADSWGVDPSSVWFTIDRAARVQRA